jgi:hypothetical protein
MENMGSAPDFLHIIDDSEDRLIVSRCIFCGVFIAASPSLKVLRMAEAFHDCPAMLGRFSS